MYIQRKGIKANTEVEVAPEAAELLFEAQDVADLIAAVTEEEVQVESEGEEVVFTVAPEGDEEVLESVRTGKAPVKANRAAKRVVRPSRRARR